MSVLFLGRLFDRVDLTKPVSNVRPCVHFRLYVRPSTKSFFHFNEIWRVGGDRWVMHDGMQYDPILGQGHEPFKVGNPSIFTSCLLCHLQWELATDHWFLNYGTITTFDLAGCLIFILVVVTWLRTWHKRQLWRVDHQSHTGLIYSFFVGNQTEMVNEWVISLLHLLLSHTDWTGIRAIKCICFYCCIIVDVV